MRKRTFFCEAQRRVWDTPELNAHDLTLFLANKPGETDRERFRWIASAPVNELVSWAQDIENRQRAKGPLADDGEG